MDMEHEGELGAGFTVLTDLYRASRQCDWAHFKNQALQSVAALVAFDVAIWCLGVPEKMLHCMHTYCCDSERDAGCMPDQHILPLMRNMTDSPLGLTRIVRLHIVARETSSDPLATGTDELAYHALATLIDDHETALHNLIVLLRAPMRGPFTERDRTMNELIAPHLVSACNSNQLLQLTATSHGDCPCAIADRRGQLHHVAAEFSPILHKEWPDWRGPFLPFSLDMKLTKDDTVIIDGQRIIVMASQHKEMVHLRTRIKSRMENLSLRERLVTKHLVDGLSYKDISRALEISPSTVTKHVNSIYRKLGVKSKTGLAKLFRDSNSSTRAN